MQELTHFSLDLQPGGTCQLNYRDGEGAIKSFDPAQLPDLAKEVVGQVLIQQQAKIEELVPVAAQVEQALVAKEAAEAEVISIRDELIGVRGQLIDLLNPKPVEPGGDATETGGVPPVSAAEEAPAQ